MLAAGEIPQVVAVGVGFPLKRDIAVGGIPGAVLDQTEKPLDQVDDIKGHEQQFALLGGVDPLVVYHIAVDPVRVSCPECPEQVHTISFRNQLTAYDHNMRKGLRQF